MQRLLGSRSGQAGFTLIELMVELVGRTSGGHRGPPLVGACLGR
jgi:hypothetical protein